MSLSLAQLDVRFPASVEGKADLSAFRPGLGYLDAVRLAATVRYNSLKFRFRKHPRRQSPLFQN
jgi:hypothetical protein